MTSFLGMLSSCTSLLARLLTSIFTDLLVTRTNSLAVKVRKGAKLNIL